jgi:hypothetical protein
MKDIPKRIFLQVGDGDSFNTAYEVTWCSSRVDDTDIEYVRKPKAPRKTKGKQRA